jgi:hypothetical protein
MSRSSTKSLGRFTSKGQEVNVKNFEKYNSEFEKKRAEYEKYKDQPAPHEDPLLKITTERPRNKDAPVLNNENNVKT